MRNTLAFSLRALRRDWHAGELRILVLALVIAVASMTAVGFFTDRVRKAMDQQAAELLAADLVLASSDPLRGGRLEQARRLGLRTADTLSFRSIVLVGDKTQLVEVKAVSPAYPLRGLLRAAAEPFAQDEAVRAIPGPGEVWGEARLLQGLAIKVQDKVRLGRTELRVTRVLSYEPDRGGDLFSIAPRLMMNIKDVPATGLMQAGSRANHRLLLAGTPQQVQAFRRWLSPRLAANERLLTLEEGRPELRAALERAQRFLGLVSLVSVLIAGVAVAMAARRYAQRHLDTSAIMRCLGATQADITRVFLWQMAWLGLAGSLAGCLAGYAAQTVLAQILSGFVAGELPAPSLRPALIGLPAGIIVLLGFAMPPILALKHVPPARVLRRELGPVPPRSVTVYAVALATMGILMWWQARDLTLVGYLLGGATVTLLGLGLAAYLLVHILNGLRQRVGVAWRFGFANIARRARGSMVQIVALGLGIMVLLLLSIVRNDLLEGWRRTVPPDAPNHFLINVQPDQVAPLQRFLSTHGIGASGLYPMVRARLVAINGQAVTAETYSDPRAQRLALREFNLSWASRPQTDNRVVAGKWWPADEQAKRWISFEQGLAETLGLRLGDVLIFNIAGTQLELKITNLRSVEWDSFNVNFFAVLPPGVLEAYPATYVTSLYLPAADKPLLASLIKQFPNVTVLDVEALLNKVRAIMDRVSLALEFVFLFTLLAGLTVLYAAIEATQDERRFEGAILRTLGARRWHLLNGLFAEFLTLGLLAGLLAALAASVLARVLAQQVFHFSYAFNPWIWLLGTIAGALGVGIAGTLGARQVLRQPPLKTLREL